MAGYFRQLADRIMDPAPGLRPLGIVSGVQMRDHGFEELPAPIGYATRPRAVAADHIEDPSPERTSRDGPAKRPMAEADAIVMPPGNSLRTSEGTQPTVPSPIDVEGARPTAQHVLPQPSPTDVRVPPAAHDREREQAAPLASVSPRPTSALQTPSRLHTRPAVVPSTPTRTRQQPDRRIRRADAETAPEVHIHIGRIELTAVAPPKPPRRESAAARKPMSLDEYLQHRNRKTP